MRLYEHEAKLLSKEDGLLVPRGKHVDSPEAAFEAAKSLAVPVVIKAQVLAGGRGKAGGIQFAETPEEAGEIAAGLLSKPIRGITCASVLVEERLDILTELYLGITVDEIAKRVVVILGMAGGMDVEDAAAGGLAFLRYPVDPFVGLQPYRARELASQVTSGRTISQLADVITRLYALYERCDAAMAEINPLAITRDGRVVAADCRIEIDDDALFRQQARLAALGIPIRQERGREPTELEVKAAEVDALDHRGVAGRVVEFDGNIALIIGGGGASLTVFDAILHYGGKPANYCEIGGNPTVRKVQDLTRLLMSKPNVSSLAIITNVLSNTRVDLVARGVIKGLLDAGIDPKSFPIVMRSSGSWEDEGYQILDKYGIKWFDRTYPMDEAARYIVEVSKALEVDNGNPR